MSYSVSRFVNSHNHLDDRLLRPLPHLATTPPLTEDQSRTRMATILAAAAAAAVSAPAQKD
jgi:hypothetical protein